MTKIAMQALFLVWMKSSKRLTKNGLSRYYGEGIGIPTETEAVHFDAQLNSQAANYDLSKAIFENAYQSGTLEMRIDNSETAYIIWHLDNYFLHDRSL